MILYIIHKVPLFRQLYFNKIGRSFVEKKIDLFTHILSKDTAILDIGSGNGLVTHLLREKGFEIVPIDIQEGSYHHSVKPIVYDGITLPFADDTFQTGIILTVLHHIDDPEKIIKEAMRVCKELIIMEDIYDNKTQQYLTYFLDRTANLFYSPCPHTNKNDTEWKATFEKYGLELKSVKYRKVFHLVKQGVYHVARKPTSLT